MKKRIIIDANIPFIRGAFDNVAEVEYLPAKEITRDRVMDADAVIVRTRTRCDAELLEGTKVKIVATATIGIDHIDTDYCDAKGIKWTNAPGCNAESVAQWVGSALAVWAEKQGCSLVGKKIGIVGHGHVGSRVERLARKLGMEVMLNDPPKALNNPTAYVDLSTIARECDVVTFHTPLTKGGEFATYGLAGKEFFEEIKKRSKSLTENIFSLTEPTESTEGVLLRSPLIINAARGGIVDEMSLLESGCECAIDCWDGEPETNAKLRNRALIATPHIAGYSADGKYNASQQVIAAVAKELNLEPCAIEGLPEWETTDAEGDELCKLLLKNYDIRKDSKALKAEPEKFEWFRSNYPVRRELKIY